MPETLDIMQVHNTVFVSTHLNLLSLNLFRCQIDELNNNFTTVITAIRRFSQPTCKNLNYPKWNSNKTSGALLQNS